MSADSPRLRLSILGVVALSLFAALFARIWFLQVIGAPEFQLAAEVMRTREIQIEAPRGRILDAQGRVIVDNRISTVVTLDRRELEEAADREDVLARLAAELTRAGHPTKVADLEARLVDPRFNPIQPVPVATDVDEVVEVFLVERHDEFPGVAVERQTVRTYPYGELAAHVVGYVGKINEEELEARMGTPEEPLEHPKPYQPDDHIGKTGVERIFEDDLRGTPGVRSVEVDVRGEIIRTLSYDPPVPGADVQLTIDLEVQAVTEQELRVGLEAARARPARSGPPTEAPAGSAVVLDPRNGAVLAMASFPNYNPEEFVGGITTARYEELKAQGDPFTNRAISGQYAPASTFKLVTAYAALNTGLISPGTTFNAQRTYTIQGCSHPSCTFTQPGGGNGVIAVQTALTVSSDTFFYWIADRFWRERGTFGEAAMQEAARAFGLGSPTGIALPFERAGVVPDPEQRRQRHEENPEAFPNADWFAGDNVITSIGQGDVLVTPLQLANLYGTFANGGTRYSPNIVARILAPGSDPADPEVLREVQPRVAGQVDLPPWLYGPMAAGFDGVTKQGGTAASAFAGWDHSLWSVAGKTGTAEVDGKADTALFAGYGPVSDPQYVAAVIIEEGGFGGQVAAPIVRRIFEPLANAVPMPPVLTLAERAAAPPPEPVEPPIVVTGAYD